MTPMVGAIVARAPSADHRITAQFGALRKYVRIESPAGAGTLVAATLPIG